MFEWMTSSSTIKRSAQTISLDDFSARIDSAHKCESQYEELEEMSYTIVEISQVNMPMIAIRHHGDWYEAEPIIAIGVYRDVDVRGGLNYLMPLTPADLAIGQGHHFANHKAFTAALPFEVVVSQRLLDAVLTKGADQGGSAEVELSNAGWTVSA